MRWLKDRGMGYAATCVLIACVPASRGRGVLIIVGIQFRIYYILGCRTSMSIVVCRAVDHGLLSSARAPGSQGSGRPDGRPAHRASRSRNARWFAPDVETRLD